MNELYLHPVTCIYLLKHNVKEASKKNKFNFIAKKKNILTMCKVYIMHKQAKSQSLAWDSKNIKTIKGVITRPLE